MTTIDANEEKNLVKRCLGGERWAFDKLMTSHQERVYRIAHGMLGDHDSAADITQDVFIRAFRSLSNFEGRSRFGTWLHRITVNHCIAELRKRRLREIVSLSAVTNRLRSRQGRPSTDLDNKQLRERVDAAVATLPPRQRAVFVLRHDEEMSHAEISAVLGISEGGVRASYHHALLKLREELRDDDQTAR